MKRQKTTFKSCETTSEKIHNAIATIVDIYYDDDKKKSENHKGIKNSKGELIHIASNIYQLVQHGQVLDTLNEIISIKFKTKEQYHYLSPTESRIYIKYVLNREEKINGYIFNPTILAINSVDGSREVELRLMFADKNGDTIQVSSKLFNMRHMKGNNYNALIADKAENFIEEEISQGFVIAQSLLQKKIQIGQIKEEIEKSLDGDNSLWNIFNKKYKKLILEKISQRLLDREIVEKKKEYDLLDIYCMICNVVNDKTSFGNYEYYQKLVFKFIMAYKEKN